MLQNLLLAVWNINEQSSSVIFITFKGLILLVLNDIDFSTINWSFKIPKQTPEMINQLKMI